MSLVAAAWTPTRDPVSFSLRRPHGAGPHVARGVSAWSRVWAQDAEDKFPGCRRPAAPSFPASVSLCGPRGPGCRCSGPVLAGALREGETSCCHGFRRPARAGDWVQTEMLPFRCFLREGPMASLKKGKK